MKRKKKRKYKDPNLGKQVLTLVVLLLILAALLSVKYLDASGAFAPKPYPTTYPTATPGPTFEITTESGVVIRTEVTPAPRITPTPSPEPTPEGAVPTEVPPPVVVIENQGSLEILIPEELDSEGF